MEEFVLCGDALMSEKGPEADIEPRHTNVAE